MKDIKIPILMYHSIESMPRSTSMRSLHVSPKRFNFQMWLLKILGYKGLSLRQLKPYLDGKKTGKVVGITFDDGYKNNLFNAAPILLKNNFSATCYLVSQRIGLSNSWDSPQGITQSPLMNHNEIQEWVNLGMEIGAHTLTHPDLTRLSEAQAKQEIEECKNELETLYNLKVQDFCYPYGRYNDSSVKLVKNAGFSTATSMNRGRAQSNSKNLELPRIPITHHTLPYLFLVKLLTNYEDRRFKK